MFPVVDAITFSTSLLREHPEWRERYGCTGLLAVLDPAAVQVVPVVAGALMRVHRPDGSRAEHVVTVVGRPSTAVGLFFPHLTAADIPRLSLLEPITDDSNAQPAQGAFWTGAKNVAKSSRRAGTAVEASVPPSVAAKMRRSR